MMQTQAIDMAINAQRYGREPDLDAIMLIERQPIGSKDDFCECHPVCHMPCNRSQAQHCSNYQTIIELYNEQIPNE